MKLAWSGLPLPTCLSRFLEFGIHRTSDPPQSLSLGKCLVNSSLNCAINVLNSNRIFEVLVAGTLLPDKHTNLLVHVIVFLSFLVGV